MHARLAPLPRIARLALALAAGLAVAGRTAAADDAVTRLCTPPPPGTQVEVTFKPELSIADLATWIAALTCESVVIAPDVAKHATKLQVIVPGPLTVADARRLFVRSLEAAGLKVKYARRVYTVTLGPGMPRTCPDIDTGDGEASDGARPLDSEAADDKLAAGVRRIDATHVELPRALFDRIVAEPTILSRAARVMPSTRGAVIDGFKLYAVRPGGLLGRIGLTNGDTITALGGVSLDSLDHAMAAVAALRTATRIELAIVRRGHPATLVVTIVP